MESQDRPLIPEGEALVAVYRNFGLVSVAQIRGRFFRGQNLWRRLFLNFHSEHGLTMCSDNIALFDEALTCD